MHNVERKSAGEELHPFMKTFRKGFGAVLGLPSVLQKQMVGAWTRARQAGRGRKEGGPGGGTHTGCGREGWRWGHAQTETPLSPLAG